MKKSLLIIVLSFFLFVPIAFASTNTFPRTEENYLVPSDVQVTDANKMDILKTPAVDSSEKLYDFADLFTDQEEADIYQKIYEYMGISQYDVAIVTTKDMNGFIIGDYTNNFYDYNSFKDEGIIFTIYIGGIDPQIYMGVNGLPESEIRKIYTDARTKQTLEYVYKDIKAGNYFLATDNYVKILKGFYEIDHEKSYVIDDKGNVVKDIPWTEIIILASALSFIIVFLLVNRLKKYNVVKYSDNIESKLDSNSVSISTEKDELVDRVLSKAK